MKKNDLSNARAEAAAQTAGGLARAKVLPPEKRLAISKKATATRWGKLDGKKARAIAKSNLEPEKLAKKYGVSEDMILKVKSGWSWGRETGIKYEPKNVCK
jgi:hypothetical protein